MILFVFAFFSRQYTWFLKREWLLCAISTAQKMKLSIKDFFSKCDQICRKLRIWSHLLTKSLMENFIFWCSVPFFIYFLQSESDCVSNDCCYDVLFSLKIRNTLLPFYSLSYLLTKLLPYLLIPYIKICY